MTRNGRLVPFGIALVALLLLMLVIGRDSSTSGKKLYALHEGKNPLSLRKDRIYLVYAINSCTFLTASNRELDDWLQAQQTLLKSVHVSIDSDCLPQNEISYLNFSPLLSGGLIALGKAWFISPTSENISIELHTKAPSLDNFKPKIVLVEFAASPFEKERRTCFVANRNLLKDELLSRDKVGEVFSYEGVPNDALPLAGFASICDRKLGQPKKSGNPILLSDFKLPETTSEVRHWISSNAEQESLRIFVPSKHPQ